MKPALFVAVLVMAGSSAMAQSARFDAASAERFAKLALDCVHKEYPNKIAHVLNGEQDVRPPHELTPAFYGCYDWHSSVHGHWLLARLARTYPDAPFARPAREALAQSLTAENIAAEARYMKGAGRASFERPYGLAWLLQLAAEVREWNDPQAKEWAATLKPLEDAAVDRLKEWLPKLSRPIRIGEHDQTAFAFGLVLDWARGAGHQGMIDMLTGRIRDFYLKDRGCPFAWEPNGQDFLSPCLAEADLMRRVLPPPEFATWLTAFLPDIPLGEKRGSRGQKAQEASSGAASWLEPAVVTDPSDPKLAHLDGLNLSRAWMLEGIAAGLPPGDNRLSALRAAASRHRDAGLRAITGEHYEGSHWLGSFAVYLVTGRGIAGAGGQSGIDDRR